MAASDFYSHAPRGARRNWVAGYQAITNFYSHAPRGARQPPRNGVYQMDNFYSHAPRGARPQYIEYLSRPHPIYREKRNLNQISCAFGAHFFFFIMANIAVFIEHHRFARRSAPSNNDCPLRIISFLHADMLDFLFPMIPQIIESHAICIFIHNFQKFLF